MDFLTASLLGAVFLFAASLVVLVYLAWTESRFVERFKIKKRLLYISAGGMHGRDKLLSYRERALREVGVWERFALKLPRSSTLDGMLLKSKLPLNASTFCLCCLGLGGIGLFAGLKFMPQAGAAVLLGMLFSFLPFLYLKLAEKKYFEKFQEQLPEALDLLSRALRSGHALSSGLDMVGKEMSEPIKSEFAEMVDEVNLGLSMDEAFQNLCTRVPSTDLRFFTIAVLVQKQTGGNVAEILDNISRLIRERIQFARQVQALTAEGRYSAGVLIALPIVMFLYMYVVRNEYIALLWTEEIGQQLIAGAVVLQIIGAFVIKKIVTIEI
jgi:tight adherence protein B